MARLTRIESAALTKEKLLNAALTVFARYGFSGTTIDLIAETAGFSRGAFYAHFSSKEEILLAIAKSQADEIAPLFIERIDAASSANEMIEIVTDLLVQRNKAQGLAIAVMDALKDNPRRLDDEGQFTEILTANWRRIGEALRRFFPNNQTPCEPDEIIAILVALTYSPIVGGVTNYQAKRLVEITLSALVTNRRDPPS